jgi:hypothetical protein
MGSGNERCPSGTWRFDFSFPIKGSEQKAFSVPIPDRANDRFIATIGQYPLLVCRIPSRWKLFETPQFIEHLGMFRFDLRQTPSIVEVLGGCSALSVRNAVLADFRVA